MNNKAEVALFIGKCIKDEAAKLAEEARSEPRSEFKNNLEDISDSLFRLASSVSQYPIYWEAEFEDWRWEGG